MFVWGQGSGANSYLSSHSLSAPGGFFRGWLVHSATRGLCSRVPYWKQSRGMPSFSSVCMPEERATKIG